MKASIFSRACNGLRGAAWLVQLAMLPAVAASSCLCAFGQTAPAAGLGQTLNRGMGYYDVLRLWGAPREKQQREAKREEVWLYDGGKVFFHEGRVAAWVWPASSGSGSTTEKLTERNNALKGRPENAAKREAAEEVLTEILRDMRNASGPQGQKQ